MRICAVFLIVILTAGLAMATIHYVPSVYPTIQAGVTAALPGDTVMVAAGTYAEHVEVGASLSLIGESMDNTIIDAQGYGRCITVNITGGSSDGLITGFTLTNSGQGIYGSFGCAGICVYTQGNGDWLISWNKFIDNPDIGYLCFDGGTVERSIFENNGYAGNYRRAIMASSYSSLDVINCDFRNNNVGVYAHSAAGALLVKNNIVTDNTYGIDLANSTHTIEYNDVWNNTVDYSGCTAGTGDISDDPDYVGGTPFDYHLTSGSPCIDTGCPTDPNDPDGTRCDMGVYYYDQGGSSPIVIELTYQSGSPVSPNGGNIYFDVYMENVSSDPQDFDAWLDITYAGGPPTTVVLRTFTNYQAGWTTYRPMMYYPVPGGWAAGNYMMYGRVGNHPNDIWDESSFPFEKSGSDFISGFVPTPVDNAPNIFGDDVDAEIGMVVDHRMLESYPNPFNPEATLTFLLAQNGPVTLAVYDVAGREVAHLIDGYRAAGAHQVTFNGQGLPSGMYFAKLTAGSQVQTTKLMLLK